MRQPRHDERPAGWWTGVAQAVAAVSSVWIGGQETNRSSNRRQGIHPRWHGRAN